MSNNSKEQIDAGERKVLRELQRYFKENIDKIANRSGFPTRRALRIVKKLEKDKTIWGYNAVIDEEKLGLKKYILLIKRTNKPLLKDELETVVNGKIKQKFIDLGVDVDFILFVNGCYDFALCATSENIRVIKKFCEEIRAVFKDCISEIQVLEVIFPLQQSGFYNPNLKGLLNYFSSDLK